MTDALSFFQGMFVGGSIVGIAWMIVDKTRRMRR